MKRLASSDPKWWIAAVLAILLCGAGEARPQPSEASADLMGEDAAQEARLAAERLAITRLLVRLALIPSPTGDEAPLREAVRAEFTAGGPAPRLSTDRLGNLHVNVAAGEKDTAAGSLLFLMPLDDPTYAVSGFHPGGWLRVVPLARPPFPAEFHRHMAGAEVWVIRLMPGTRARAACHSN